MTRDEPCATLSASEVPHGRSRHSAFGVGVRTPPGRLERLRRRAGEVGVTVPWWRAAGLSVLALVASALTGCAGIPPGGVEASGQIRVLSTTVAGTPTLGPTSGPMLYVPLVLQGLPLEPTPTATRRPGGPTPSPLTDAVLVAYSTTSQRSSPDGFVLDVEGEVRNDGSMAVQGVRVVVEGRNRSGSCGRGTFSLLGKAEVVLLPGESWPFSGTLGLRCEAETVNLTTVAVQTEREPVRLVMEDTAVGVTEAGDWELRGMLRNPTAAVVAYPRVVLTLRKAGGEYLSSNVAYTALDRLEPGEVTPFAVSIAKSRMTGWADFEALATGEKR